MITERPYQTDVQDEITTLAAKGFKRILCVAPCGSGKTIISSKIIQNAAANGKRVLFLAHLRELIHQTSEKLYSLGIEHGVIMADELWDNAQNVQVASIQTLYHRAIRRTKIALPKADLIVIDEAHHFSTSEAWKKIVEKFPDAYILGLTATPINKRGLGLGHYFDAMAKCPGINELIDQKYLVPARYFAPVIPDLSKVRVKMGEYVEADLEQVFDKKTLLGDVVENFLRICPTRKAIVFGVSVRHSIHLAESFNAVGIKAKHIDGTTPGRERREIIQDFKEGKIQVLSNCAVFSEGFDSPEADCLIMAMSTKSLGRFLQITGRIIRTATNKKDAIIIDHGGNIREHGFLTQNFDWKLDYGEGKTIKDTLPEKKERNKREITCEQCKRVYSESLICPDCGHKPTYKGKYVETYEAYLEEINKLEKPRGTTDPLTWYLAFRHEQKKRGLKDNYSEVLFKKKFGEWPKAEWYDLEPVTPPNDVQAYIRSRQIAYAYAMKKAREQKIAAMKAANKP